MAVYFKGFNIEQYQNSNILHHHYDKQAVASIKNKQNQ
jgi:hypothetical protein